ncbi:class II aldolase/adducin family protein [Kurthia sibirica]|uniref:class II aldolase/adducin family protein n=1 Tax=Kurthia sibirica TaxID=202750 RepID=UPI0011685415|nr:class II aldolase/adducin family protein [Kurthia sibirica]GEK35209.1 fuculose phosphate aldolase [Kurthia sibirica]
MSHVIEQLDKYAKELVASGLVVGAGGNLSMRDGDYMYISPSGYDLKEIKKEEWVKVHIISGEVYGSIKPSSELLMHLACFRENEEITAVLHAHPTYSVSVSSTGKEIPALFPDFPAMVKDVAYIDYVIPTTELLANEVANHAQKAQVMVLRNHGVITLGKTMKEAYFFMQLTEESAKVFAISQLFGGARHLTEEECEALRNLSSEKFRSKLLKE